MKFILAAVITLGLSSVSLADHSGDEKHSHHKKTERVIKVEIGKKGFKPAAPLHFKPKENIVLNITRTSDKTCMKSLKHPRTGALIKLPMNKEVRFEIGEYAKEQEIKLLCGMGMKAGVIYVAEKQINKG